MKQHLRTFLMTALAVLGLVARGEEFTYEWHTTTDPITRPNTTDDVLSDVTAYLIDADKLQQQTLLTSFFEDGGHTSFDQLVNETGALLSSATVNAEGLVDNTKFTQPGEGTAGHAYFVLSTVLDDESLLYFSGYSTLQSSSGSGDGTLVLNAKSSHGGIHRTTKFQGDPKAGDGGGWYGDAVPEPTGGLLVLLGIAALAGKRRYEG